MTKDQAFSTAEEEWESMNWRERVGALDCFDNTRPVMDDYVGAWLEWMDKPRPFRTLYMTSLSFEAFLNHLAHDEWIPARAEYLYTEAQADACDRVYDMKKEEGW